MGLYEEPERPANAVDYIKRYMGAPVGIDVEALRAECEQLKKEKQELENTVKELNSRVIYCAANLMYFIMCCSCRMRRPAVLNICLFIPNR